jgi:hypothetical protein
MKQFLLRLFIKFPLHVINFALCLTLVIPVLFWLITGEGMDNYVSGAIDDIGKKKLDD